VTVDFQFWYTLLIVLAMLGALAFEVAQTALILTAALLLLVFGGVIGPGEAFQGFSNEGMLTVGFLFVVASGLHATGVFSKMTYVLFGKERGNPRSKLIRVLFPVAGISAFINNTPLVAILIPAVRSWCRRLNFPSSKLLIPLSYATILGGLCTLIGTSTNLVIHGLLIDHGYPGFTFFELGRVGLPMAVVGILAVALVLHRFLPKRKEVAAQLGDEVREFVIEMKVNAAYPEIGNSVQSAGLRRLKGLFLFQIERDGKMIAPVTPTEKIHEGDRLFFTGIPETIVELQKSKGLDVVRDVHFDLKNYDSEELKTYEVVISPKSPLIDRTVRESNFRRVYDAVILALHRSGERVNRKIGDIRIRAGDTLLILASHEFHTKWYHSSDFSLVSTSEEVPSKTRIQATLAMVIGALMVLAATIEFVPMSVAAASAALLLVLTRCLPLREAFNGVDLGVMLSIACALGIARAVENSGVAEFVAHGLLGVSAQFGTLVIIAAIYGATLLITEIVSNNAAAAIMFPIGLSVAASLETGIMPFMYAITLGASAAFATPIGYQTNLMVQGPGGYKFLDYVKVGLPLDLIVGSVCVTMIHFLFF